MKTLMTLTLTLSLVLSTSALADESKATQQDGQGLHPEWLLNHAG